MKKITITLSLILLIISCKNKDSGKKEVQNSSTDTETTIDSVQEKKSVENQEKNNTDLISLKNFKASGSEPGWSLEANKKGNNISYNVTLDNGNVKTSGDNGEFKPELGTLNIIVDNKALLIKLTKKPCNDMAGNPHEISVHFNYKGTKYIGCGDINTEQVLTPKKYICFKNDDNQANKLSLGLENDTLAISVKYKGQKESIPLVKVKSEYASGGTSPVITDFYNEIYKGEINGSYKLTKSGNWYYLNYTRKSDQKEFKYTIDHSSENFTSKPCF